MQSVKDFTFERQLLMKSEDSFTVFNPKMHQPSPFQVTKTYNMHTKVTKSKKKKKNYDFTSVVTVMQSLKISLAQSKRNS